MQANLPEKSLLSELEKESISFWREINPCAKSCKSMKTLLEIYASQSNWEQVLNLSSRAVLHLTHNYSRADFYYIWISALNEMQDYQSLGLLGRHLLRMRKYHSVFVSLALLSFFYAGHRRKVFKIMQYLMTKDRQKDRFTTEAIAIVMSSSRSEFIFKKGLFSLGKLCSRKQATYFTLRNYLRCLSQKNCFEKMSELYNTIHYRFPFAQEPYLAASLIAMKDEDWKEAIRILSQLIKDNPNNTDALLALAQCFEEDGQIEQALKTLTSHKQLFTDYDYDFHYSMARILSKCTRANQQDEHSKEVVTYFEKSILLAEYFGFSNTAIKLELDKFENNSENVSLFRDEFVSQSFINENRQS